MTLAHGVDEWQEINYPHLGIKIKAALNRPLSEITDNVRINSQRGLPQVWPHAKQDTVLAICAGGPSLSATLGELKQAKQDGAKVVALAGAANFLLKNGITPDCHILLDSRIGNTKFITDTKCKYLVASQCDPAVFDALKGRDVLIWHAINQPADAEEISKHYEAWVPVSGGNTIALRAIRLMQILGYYRFHLFGMDSCILDGEHHAYEQDSADDTPTTTIALNGKPFIVTAWQIQQAMEFMKMVKTFGMDWEIVSHGEGLITHMIKEGAK